MKPIPLYPVNIRGESRLSVTFHVMFIVWCSRLGYGSMIDIGINHLYYKIGWHHSPNINHCSSWLVIWLYHHCIDAIIKWCMDRNNKIWQYDHLVRTPEPITRRNYLQTHLLSPALVILHWLVSLRFHKCSRVSKRSLGCASDISRCGRYTHLHCISYRNLTSITINID